MRRGESIDPVYVLTTAAARRVDGLASRRYAIPPAVLMENASRHACDVALDGLEHVREPRVFLVGGPGNNGGDALAMARHLHNAGARVGFITPLGVAPRGPAARQLKTALAMNLPRATQADPARALDHLRRTLGEPHLIVDGLFGTGLDRPLKGRALSAVRAMNAWRARGVGVLALDIPSGLCSEQGVAMPEAVRASVTVTFVGLKPGLLALQAQGYVGEVVVADIGAPRELVASLGTPLHAPGRGSGGGAVTSEPPPDEPQGRGRRRG